MNREDVIRMAREADACHDNVQVTPFLERFAALVAAAAIKDAPDYKMGYADGVAAEREACAKVCEAGIHNATDWDSSYWDQGVQQCAIAIRARSRND